MAEGRPSDLTQIIQELERRLRIVENGATNYVPGYATDPTNPRDGLIWYNTAQNRFKIRMGGITHYLTRDGTG